MIMTEVFMTSDGQVFHSERDAEAHQIDILGELLDDFLPHDDRGNVTYSDRFNILMKQLKDEKLLNKIKKLYDTSVYIQEHGIEVARNPHVVNR